MTSWGYARVSTVDQDPQLQVDALTAAGVDVDHLVIEHASGARTDRPELAGLLERLGEGDVLTVWKLDRLGRSVSHLVHVVDELRERGVEFRSLTEGIDTTTAGGRLVFHIFAAVAEFERSLTRERTTAALAAAKARGKPIGRPSKVTREQYDVIHLLARHGVPHGRIAATVGLTRAVVGRVARGEIESLARKYGHPEPDRAAAGAALSELYPTPTDQEEEPA